MTTVSTGTLVVVSLHPKIKSAAMQACNQDFSGTILFKEKVDIIGLDMVQVSECVKARWSEDCFTTKNPFEIHARTLNISSHLKKL